MTRAALILIVILASILPASAVSAANPVVITLSAEDETDTTATLTGQLSSLGTFAGPNVYLYFQFCTDGYYDAYAGAYDRKTPEITWPIASGLTNYAADLTGLANGNEYHFRAALRYGTNYVYGADVTFFTNMNTPANTPQIYSLKAYKNLLETNDTLFVILANIDYPTVPAIPVSRTFIWSLMDTGAEKGWNVGYAMNENGYGFNVYSLYFNAAAAITWGNVSKYNVQLTGAPEIFAVPLPVYDNLDAAEYAVTADVWTSASDYKVKLAEDLLAVAKTLEQEWQVVLLDEQDTKTVLSSNGEKLFRNAMPGIQTMAPSLFYVQDAVTVTTARVWNTSLDTTYKERLLGPDKLPGGGDDNWIAGSLVGVADWLNIPWLLFVAILCIGVCVFIIFKSSQKYGTPVPGYVASLLVVSCFGMLMLGLTLIALIAFILILIGGWLLFMRRA